MPIFLAFAPETVRIFSFHSSLFHASAAEQTCDISPPSATRPYRIRGTECFFWRIKEVDSNAWFLPRRRPDTVADTAGNSADALPRLDYTEATLNFGKSIPIVPRLIGVMETDNRIFKARQYTHATQPLFNAAEIDLALF